MNTLKQQILHDLELLPEAMQSETLDFVQFLKKKLEQNKATLATEITLNGQVLADILEEASKHNLFTEIEDPGSWQREVRRDRPLPGRGKR